MKKYLFFALVQFFFLSENVAQKNMISFNPQRFAFANLPESYTGDFGVSPKILATYKRKISEEKRCWISGAVFYYKYKLNVENLYREEVLKIGDSIVNSKQIHHRASAIGIRLGIAQKTRGNSVNLSYGIDATLLNRKIQERINETKGEFPNYPDNFLGKIFDSSSYKNGVAANKILFGLVPNISLNFRLRKNIWLALPLEMQFFLEKNQQNNPQFSYWRASFLPSFSYYF